MSSYRRQTARARAAKWLVQRYLRKLNEPCGRIRPIAVVSQNQRWAVDGVANSLHVVGKQGDRGTQSGAKTRLRFR